MDRVGYHDGLDLVVDLWGGPNDIVKSKDNLPTHYQLKMEKSAMFSWYDSIWF